jgi:hypothetical protein
MQWSVKKDVLFEDLLDRSSRLLAQRNLEPVEIVHLRCNFPRPVRDLLPLFIDQIFMSVVIFKNCRTAWLRLDTHKVLIYIESDAVKFYTKLTRGCFYGPIH